MARTEIDLVTEATLSERVAELGFERWEVVRGEVVQVMPAKDPQGRIAARIVVRLGAHVEQHRLGETFASEEGFRLSKVPFTIRAPDVAFVSTARLPERDPSGDWWPGAPDLAVEVVSETEGSLDVEDRIREYLRAGTREVWIVYPNVRTVRVHRSPKDVQILEEGDVIEGDALLPGFSCPVADLFPARKDR